MDTLLALIFIVTLVFPMHKINLFQQKRHRIKMKPITLQCRKVFGVDGKDKIGKVVNRCSALGQSVGNA